MIGGVSRTRAVLVALLLPLVGLAACTDDDPEPAPPLPTTEAPTSPSATTAAPDDPEETVRAWVEAQNQSMTNGDTTEVRSLSSADCKSCDGLINPIERVFAAGGHFETAGWKVNRLKETESTSRRSTVKAAITISGGQTYESANADPVVYESERAIVEFKLAAVEGEWRVSFIGFVS